MYHLYLRRITSTAKPYTIGKLHDVQSGRLHYLCDTLEDEDRLTRGEKKVYGKTAIPLGDYEVKLTFSTRFSSKAFYRECRTMLPLLCNVPQFEGVRIHVGNTPADTEGCVLVGENKAVGQVLNSKATYRRILPLIQKAIGNGETVILHVTRMTEAEILKRLNG